MAGEVLGIDVGGSSVKAGLVDVERGSVHGTLISAPTPRPCTPDSLTAVNAVPALMTLGKAMPTPRVSRRCASAAVRAAAARSSC